MDGHRPGAAAPTAAVFERISGHIGHLCVDPGALECRNVSIGFHRQRPDMARPAKLPESSEILAAGPVSNDTLYLAHQDGFRYPAGVVITKVTDNGQTLEQYPAGAGGLTIVASTASQSIGPS